MNNGNDDNASRRKKPYRTPELVVVSLRPDEAVLGACKTSSASGPGSKNKCNPGTCRSQGS